MDWYCALTQKDNNVSETQAPPVFRVENLGGNGSPESENLESPIILEIFVINQYWVTLCNVALEMFINQYWITLYNEALGTCVINYYWITLYNVKLEGVLVIVSEFSYGKPLSRTCKLQLLRFLFIRS